MPRVTVVWSDILVALFLFSFVFIGVHYFGNLFLESARSSTTETKSWKGSTSIAATFLLVVLFGSGISMVAIAHQCVWAVAGTEPVFEPFHAAARRSQSRNNLKHLALEVHRYEKRHQHFPSGATIGTSGELMQSWETQILPYIEEQKLYDEIDLTKPWDAEKNKKYFQKEIYGYL